MELFRTFAMKSVVFLDDNGVNEEQIWEDSSLRPLFLSFYSFCYHLDVMGILGNG